MFLFSFVKSYVLYPNHYEWAAFQRDGIGLSYLFGLGVFLTFVGLINFPIPIEAMFVSFIMDSDLPMEIAEPISVFLTKNNYLLYPFALVAIGLGYAISMLNLALLFTIFLSQPFNFLTSWAGENLTFLQLLRVTCYSSTAAFVFTVLAVWKLDISFLLAGLIYLFYICAPILYLKKVQDI